MPKRVSQDVHKGVDTPPEDRARISKEMAPEIAAAVEAARNGGKMPKKRGRPAKKTAEQRVASKAKKGPTVVRPRNPAPVPEAPIEMLDPLFRDLGLVPFSQARKRNETIDEFVERILKEAPEVLIKAEGSLDIASAVFGEDVKIIADLVKFHPELSAAQSEGLAVRAAREVSEQRTADAIKQETLNQIQKADSRVKRKKWPKDDAKRMAELLAVLPQAIEDYYGDETAISTGLNLPVSEISGAIGTDVELLQEQEKAQARAIDAVEGRLLHLALTSKSPTAAIYWLKNVAPDKWSDKSTVEVKGGFSPPEEESEPASVLRLVNSKDE